MLSKNQIGIIVGLIFGDACIPSGKTTYLKVWHSQKQEAYVKHKHKLLVEMFGGKTTICYQENKHYSGKMYKTCGFSVSHPYMSSIRNTFYINGRKTFSRHALDMLTAEGIAYWFMDDGATSCRIHKERGKTTPSSVALDLSTYCSYAEAKEIQLYFMEVWGINPKIRNTGKNKPDEIKWNINFNTTESKKLAKLINPYIISEMSYKMRYVNN